MGNKYIGHHFPTLQSIVAHIFTMSRFTERGCLVFGGCKHRKGYGTVRYLGKMRKTHHLVDELFNGPIEADKHRLHECDTPSCGNPAHIYHGTNTRNIQDKVERDRSGKKLNIAKVRRIKVMLAQGFTQREIGAVFGVTQHTISKIETGFNWAHVQYTRGADSQISSVESAA